jgi:hypothetical protein
MCSLQNIAALFKRMPGSTLAHPQKVLLRFFETSEK